MTEENTLANTIVIKQKKLFSDGEEDDSRA